MKLFKYVFALFIVFAFVSCENDNNDTINQGNNPDPTPTIFSDYKDVNGIKFPYSIGIKSGPMDLKFEVKEIKINEGVTDADFD